MVTKARARFWIEAALAICTAGLLLLTLISREWIEFVFGVDPDGGSGALEWGLVVVLAVAAVAFASVARLEWQRRDVSATSQGA